MIKVKLIRDKLELCSPSTDLESVAHCRWMHAALLVSKLHEEVAEMADRMYDPSEYADVLQALTDLARLNGLTWQDIQDAQVNKFHERGGFSGGRVMVPR